MTGIEQYIDLYREVGESLCSDHSLPAAVQNARTASAGLLDKARCTSDAQAAALAPNYGFNLNRLHFPLQTNALLHCEVPGISMHQQIVVNDDMRLVAAEQETPLAGVQVLRFSDSRSHSLIEQHYGKLSSQTDITTILNTTFMQDGILIYVPAGVKVQEVLQIVNFSTSKVDLMSHRRLLIVMEEGAELSILTCDHTLNDVQFLTTQVSEIFLAQGATLNLCDLEETHARNHRLANTYIEQQSGSKLNLSTITLTAGTTFNNIQARLAGKKATLHLAGVALCDDNERLNTTTLIDHAVADTQASELYKFILDNRSVARFSARTVVQRDAQKTQSQQTAKAIALSSEARFFSEPQLEIYADDVKCGHGVGMGQLDEAALFYMQSRGIPLAEARHLLLSAFLADVTDAVAVPALAVRLRYLIDKRLRGELKECASCRCAPHGQYDCDCLSDNTQRCSNCS